MLSTKVVIKCLMKLICGYLKNCCCFLLDKLKPFLSLLFELFTRFLNYTDDRQLLENFLLTFTKTWHSITSYIMTDILAIARVETSNKKDGSIQYKNNSDSYFNNPSDDSSSRLYDNSLQFYSCFLSKLTSLSEKSSRISGLVANVTAIFDSVDVTTYEHSSTSSSLGSQLCDRLINEFDKNFLVETNQNVKLIISNIMKALMSLSHSAKQTALNGKCFVLLPFGQSHNTIRFYPMTL
jgi:hypothetical protein